MPGTRRRPVPERASTKSSDTLLTKGLRELIPKVVTDQHRTTKPPWIRLQPGEGLAFSHVRRTLRSLGLGTVCEEALCPNRAECWGCGTATFLLMGRQCTRSCRFCSVHPGRAGEPLERDEPNRVAEAVSQLKLGFAVLTSVSRDDLPDGGSEHYSRTIRALRTSCAGVGVEVLIPDYLGEPLRAVVDAQPDVLAHNVEVVRHLTPRVRDRRCSFDRSLGVLAETKQICPSLTTKSSLLLGLGETDRQIEEALDDLRSVEVDTICIGQYLQPTKHHVPVTHYVTPERFAELDALARSKGFSNVASAPLVRTSYHAADYVSSKGS